MENEKQTEKKFLITESDANKLLEFFMTVSMPRVQTDPYVRILAGLTTAVMAPPVKQKADGSNNGSATVHTFASVKGE